jgi:hypothetical protein
MQERQHVKSMSDPKEDKGRISSAFSQYDVKARAVAGSSGLALSHVRYLLSEMGEKKCLGSFLFLPALWDVMWLTCVDIALDLAGGKLR